MNKFLIVFAAFCAVANAGAIQPYGAALNYGAVVPSYGIQSVRPSYGAIDPALLLAIHSPNVYGPIVPSPPLSSYDWSGLHAPISYGVSPVPYGGRLSYGAPAVAVPASSSSAAASASASASSNNVNQWAPIAVPASPLPIGNYGNAVY